MQNSGSSWLAEIVRSRRIALGLSMSDVTRLGGVDRATLSRVENGKKTPAPDTLAALASALRLPLADLYEAAGYPLPHRLPSLRPYLRHAYGISHEAVDEIETYLRRLNPDLGQPADGEDELPD